MTTIRVATFNVSMEATNYRRGRNATLNPQALTERLRRGNHPQIRNIAEIIQRNRPDVLLLNEFDFIEDESHGVSAFIRNYLQQSQTGAQPIDYPYYYVAPVNSGEPSPYDIDGDGKATGTGGDAFGFGFYPGHYGMALLSRFPIEIEQIRTFRHLLWHTMPNHQTITNADGTPFYADDTFTGLRLSSKSHWDVPIVVGGKRIHLLAAHPTPPVFDGKERRNSARNYDEIKLWADYLQPSHSQYIVDDTGTYGGIADNEPFVVVGDYNASADEGNSLVGAIEQLLHHPKINATYTPTSNGGKQHTPTLPHAKTHTAAWRARVDYVLPSILGFEIKGGGVFWPTKSDPLHRLVQSRQASSDHRLVWIDLALC
ncbi:endonuclease/exonuclease/phosphatase family protein [Ferrimonas lipolytica]|nr:endonuclease/exonuclease/phosphatase family protein [Ferrimonas lipolytica]